MLGEEEEEDEEDTMRVKRLGLRARIQEAKWSLFLFFDFFSVSFWRQMG